MAALPYDVFDRAEAAAYVADHPLSFLAIDRPETQFAPDADMYAPEVYARGAELMHERIDEGIYQADPSMSYHLYELTQNGRTQTGVVAICSVDEYDQGIIKKHENTRAEKERDPHRAYPRAWLPDRPHFSHLPRRTGALVYPHAGEDRSSTVRLHR